MSKFKSLTLGILIFSLNTWAEQNLDSKIEHWESIASEDELRFVGQRGPMILLDLYIQAGQFEHAKQLIYTKGRSRINPQDKAEFDFMTWKVFAGLIPTDTSRCVQNPLTSLCDEGENLSFADEFFKRQHPQSPRAEEMKALAEKFYQYKIKHEQTKLNLFVAQFETAAYPQGVVSQFINNTLRENDKRTDGKVLANCVGPHGEGKLQGKCDLVYKHELVTRILGQAGRMETFAKSQDLNQVQQIKLRYLNELQKLLESSEIARREIHHSYKRINFAQEIEKYRSLLK